MRQLFFPVMVVSALALSGCGGPAVPESGATGGVGFGDYQTYLKQREAALNGGAPMPASQPVSQTTVANAGAAIGAEPIAATSLGSVSPSAPLPAGILAAVPGGTNEPYGAASAGAPLATSTMLEQTNTASYSGAPTAAAVPQNVANYQSAAPAHSVNTGPNLASYALAATNSVGQSVYQRGSSNAKSSERACNKFTSSDLAQTAFLTAGGPQKDSKNLDPDGDGFACAWDPRPFQAARAQ